VDNFRDEISLPELFAAGVEKFTPLISFGRLLQLHRYAKSRGFLVSYFEAYSVRDGLEHPEGHRNMMGFPESIVTSEELVAFADNEMREIAVWISEEEFIFGFEAYIEGDEL
jgi:hypothetical protein